MSSTPGGDGVHPQVLRSCAGLLAYPLTLLFERSLRSGDITSPWNWSAVVPLFKSGSRSSPTDYRPVSLTSVCYKTRCRRHSKYVRSLFDRFYFYKMKEVINFLRWGGLTPPYPAFLQCHRELNELTSQNTKLKPNQEIILVNICILETHVCHFRKSQS